ncbi:MAG: hypothetical protein HPY69_08690 [Armatimonadetes bacterium]|nr:hypothetical protein [Armatimonadota bacterium]
MNFIESMQVALNAILNNKVRALLTMLGVTVGVAAVILLVSVRLAKEKKDEKATEEDATEPAVEVEADQAPE